MTHLESNWYFQHLNHSNDIYILKVSTSLTSLRLKSLNLRTKKTPQIISNTSLFFWQVVILSVILTCYNQKDVIKKIVY